MNLHDPDLRCVNCDKPGKRCFCCDRVLCRACWEATCGNVTDNQIISADEDPMKKSCAVFTEEVSRYLHGFLQQQKADRVEGLTSGHSPQLLAAAMAEAERMILEGKSGHIKLHIDGRRGVSSFEPQPGKIGVKEVMRSYRVS